MNRKAVECIIGAIVALGLSAVSLILGINLLPSRLASLEKMGTQVPWFLTWGMMWTTALAGVALAGFLIVTGVSEIRRSQ